MDSVATTLRLSPAERDGIRRAVARACEETGAAWRRIAVFGSRTDPVRRGGDIDLLIEIDPRHPADLHRLTQRLRIALEDEIGAQHVDLVVDDGRRAGGFPAVARLQGVELWSNN
ncbi:MAG: nucleotidyltransferase domain-containing protein [Planctomycetia bacterium]|jgi:predicted nucleotidyltransferase